MDNSKEKIDINLILANSLANLLLEKPFEKIKVIDICKNANIPRSTFYYHFNDKYELLEFTINSLSDKLSKQVINDSSNDFLQYIDNFIKVFVEYLNENKNLYISLINKNKDEFTLNVLFTMVCSDLKERLYEEKVKGNINPSIPIDFIAEFYIGGFARLSQFWLLHTDIYDANDLYEALSSLFLHNSNNTILNP
ncbi:TetR/AcrR family transcriptional regulator C-terminal domain-containing protein [Methanobrevibacter wolinii]|uniref:TetR/AcrR family transcriptional regulator C-terminal domain-containing protein n=1 Tax=Methanobrevibacter wolinii TaxID=190977 RepID=UPI00069429E8|nr:TetR/AcrR family transcriptional regulator C-terminal domain-containing protein [Methanobrevibacter wolinii]MDD5960644.1 TetR/AcrR family transcriptional regulator C-terminal domain-containing protein [Methanobrevibacter wolinii]